MESSNQSKLDGTEKFGKCMYGIEIIKKKSTASHFDLQGQYIIHSVNETTVMQELGQIALEVDVERRVHSSQKDQ